MALGNPGKNAVETQSALDSRREHALRHLSAVIESSEDAIISKDLNGIITSWNPAAERIFGYTAQEAVGQSVLLLIPEDHHNEEPDIIRRIRAGERIEHYETVRKRKDGSLINISLTVSPVKDDRGTVIGASKIARDVTDRVHANVLLAESLLREKTAARAKDDFIAMLSHELRAPLNPILLIASDAAQNPGLPASIRAQFELIRTNARLEARLIDDLLDLNRLGHGKLQLEKQTVEINDLVRSSAQIVQGDIDARRIHLALNLTARPLNAEADPVRMQQVFWNILSNAIKFTPEGGAITIETALIDETIQIKITDNGMGMDPEELNTLFGAFVQGRHVNQARRYGGLGLGLAITKMLVEAHAGRVEAASNGRNTGSTFTIRIPRTLIPSPPPDPLKNPANPSAAAERAGRSGLRILLVEDHEPTRTALGFLLNRRGYQVVKAASSNEARSLAAAEKIDLVISDIGLPDGSGNELMAELRDQHGLRGIALTGYGMEEDVARSNAAGFATHLTKPVDISALEKALALVTAP